jgi:hypothetical protein
MHKPTYLPQLHVITLCLPKSKKGINDDNQELGCGRAHDYGAVWTVVLGHTDEMTLSPYTFAIMMKRKRGMDSTEEISHGEGPDHAVGPEQEQAQVLQSAERSRRDSADDGDDQRAHADDCVSCMGRT